MPERSFFIRGYQFPVCARCTGAILVFPVSVVLALKKKPSNKACIYLSGVMLADWMIQFLKIKESTNRRRFITGSIGGLGFNTLYMRGLFSAIKSIKNSL